MNNLFLRVFDISQKSHNKKLLSITSKNNYKFRKIDVE